MTVPLLGLLALLQSASSAPPPASQPQTPPPAAPAPADPARMTFPAGATGLVLVLVKPDRTADYDAVITALKAALDGAGPADRQAAAGWQVFKAREPDAKGNVVYVHWLPSPVAGTDYRPSLMLDRLAASLPEAVLVKYRGALAAPPSRLSLDAVATLVLAPVPPKQ